jgi:hypothetical protein
MVGTARERWVQAMQKRARNSGYPTRYEFCSLPQSGHAFKQCTDQGRIIEHVLEFFQLNTDTVKTDASLKQIFPTPNKLRSHRPDQIL